MSTIVVYKTKYGSTKTYAEWIAEELGCVAVDAKSIKADDLLMYDTVIYGGGLYAEVINGVTLITKNIEKLRDKKIIVYTTGITPRDVREYYDGEVIEKNFKNGVPENIKIFNFEGKMIQKELTPVHYAVELSPERAKNAATGKTLAQYVSAIKEVAAYYAIPVLDLYATSGIVPYVEENRALYAPDGLHPNEAGHERIAKRLEGFLISL